MKGTILAGPGRIPRFQQRARIKELIALRKGTSLQKQVKNVKKSVKDIQNREELKYIDTYYNAQAVSGTTDIIDCVNGLVQGTNEKQRDGTEVYVTSVQFRMNYAQLGTLLTEAQFRCILFWDRQPNRGNPAITAGQVLDQAVITGTLTAPYKRETQSRFKILYDKVFTLKPKLADPSAPTTTVITPKVYFKVKRNTPRVVKFYNASNTGTIADIETNALYFAILPEGGAAQVGTLTGGIRVYYKDD